MAFLTIVSPHRRSGWLRSKGNAPAADIKRLLRERTKAKGLAVPGMVAGSPGMEQGPPRPYATIVFDERGSKVFGAALTGM